MLVVSRGNNRNSLFIFLLKDVSFKVLKLFKDAIRFSDYTNKRWKIAMD